MVPTGLAGLERRAWISYHEDGLIDLAFGFLLIVAFAGSVAGEYRYVAYVLLILIGPLLALAKRLVTVPRLGAVRFGRQRMARKRHAVLIVGLMVAGTAVLPLLLGGDAWLRAHPTVVALYLSTLVALAFAAIAYWLELTRMYVVGVLFAAAFGMTEFLDTPIPFLVAGSMVALSGAARLRRFLRTYDAPAESNDVG